MTISAEIGHSPPFDPLGYPGADGKGFFPDPDSRGAVLRRRLACGGLALKSVLRGLDRDGFGADSEALLAESYMGLCVRLAAAGVAPRLGLRLFAQRLACAKPAIGLGWIEVRAGSSRKRGRSGGFWEPAEIGEGRRVWLLPLIAWSIVSRAECYEILALDPKDPALWWRRTGAVSVLGEAALETALRDAGPLKLIRDPIAWARAGGEASDAVCLLDLDAPAAHHALLSAGEIRCADVAHGDAVKRLQARLRPKLPKVMVAAKGRVA